MNKIMLLVCVFLLMNGCTAKRSAIADLSLLIAPQQPVYSGATAYIQGRDARANKEVIVFLLKDQPPMKVPNLNAPHQVATEDLAGGLREQGMMFENSGNVQILLEMDELLVTVTKPKFLYSAEARSRVTLRVVKGRNSLTKKYERQAMQESATRPDIGKLEHMLNIQLSDIINQILQDEEIRKVIISE